MHLHPNEANIFLEHLCRGYCRITSAPHWDNGLDRWFPHSGDCTVSRLHLLMVIPAFLRHPLWEQGRLQAGRVQNAIKRRSRGTRCIEAHCCLHTSQQCSASWDALDRNDQSCFPSTLLLLPSSVHQIGVGVQLRGCISSERKKAEAKGIRPFYRASGRLHAKHSLLSASEAQRKQRHRVIVRVSEGS